MITQADYNQIKDLKRLVQMENDDMRHWIYRAIQIINAGVDLMTLEQLSNWEGVRGLLEETDKWCL